MFAALSGVSVRDKLLTRLTDARAQTDALFDIVKPGSFYDRPIPERHRIVFYLGHVEAFDWNLLGERLLGVKSFQAEFDRLFAFGIDPVDGGLPSDQPADWPRLKEVQRYAGRIRQSLDDGLKGAFRYDCGPGGGEGSASLLLNVAIEHRLMHAETLAYMLHQ